jgi:uncharacterized membrane protein YraQ (UPF0718 family)
VGSFGFLGSEEWRQSLIRIAFGKSFWGFFGAALILGIVCLWVKGLDTVRDAFLHDLDLLLNLLPRVFVALSIAALIWVMVPRDRVSALVGAESGLKGLIVATFAGTITPGGPSSAYALLAVMGTSGADRGALVAYITAWATLGLQRILVWDFPFMGTDFAFLRFFVSLPLPVIAGLIARRLPFEMRVRDPEAQEGRA